MGMWFEVARGATAVNVVILLVLALVWVRNYRRFRSKHALGLLVFAVLMLAENGMALYFFTVDPMLRMVGERQVAQTILRLLMTAALVFLAWVTWD
jgi:hypothetical protein